MSKPPKKTKDVKTAFRLPAALHAEIKEAAERAGHSMNAEVIARLSTPVGHTLMDIARQNLKTQEMVQQIIDAIGPRRT